MIVVPRPAPDGGVVLDQPMVARTFDRVPRTAVLAAGAVPALIGAQRQRVVVVCDPGQPHIVVAGFRGAPGASGGVEDLQLTAAVPLEAPRVVVVEAGAARYPDLAASTDVASIIGLTITAAAAGKAVSIRVAGRFTETAWNWRPGRIYCAAVDGRLTQDVPAGGAVVEVARAINPTTIEVGIRPGILRS